MPDLGLAAGFDQLLEDPRVAGTPGVLQAYGRVGRIHERHFTCPVDLAGRHPDNPRQKGSSSQRVGRHFEQRCSGPTAAHRAVSETFAAMAKAPPDPPFPGSELSAPAAVLHFFRESRWKRLATLVVGRLRRPGGDRAAGRPGADAPRRRAQGDVQGSGPGGAWGWVALAMIFNGALWWYVGQTAGAAEANRAAWNS